MTDRNHRSFALSRRSLVKWGGAAALAASIPVTIAAATAGAEPTGKSVRLRWLGTNSWEFTTEETTVLIDPWVSRFPTGAYTEAGANPETKIEVHEDVIDEHLPKADTILVTHGHWDHIADVPYIAKKTGATVIGTETHLNLLRAMDAPEEQLGQVVGGEFYQFKGCTVEVFKSTHSAKGDHKKIEFAGTRTSVPKRPMKIKHLVEGGSLTYLLDFGGVSFFNAGSANFHQHQTEGLTPTVLFIQPGGGHTPDYVERLLKATGYPRYVVPTHWDDFDKPLTEPAVPGGDIETLQKRVAKASPDSEFVRIDHLEHHDFQS
ncbi:MBL fold metallo-hydrolase [Stackebrandtia nassauensis]|uniref:Beta-lactamase domain protein n=1 Tax=Stackebrandtia nassauensis (strain DSM 44728 / CIP 108903 / NRRL B-16338 / NBRC 102104 / LLR-40K-21) TaxID=446470 RepID=D3Q9I2_STANL|nr:MBL fold metallo-hydrolase [Stackebrandtia nassauensis]ADD42664.1 beta-lactamase domain protein [Stackebrandtia nassauensis DSM 44728]